MYKIKKVGIKGFWGNYIVENNFYKDINIFIGENGTGKTTFINIIQAALSVNIEILNKYKFSSIELVLYNQKDEMLIKVIKEEESSRIQYNFDNMVYSIPNIPVEVRTKKYSRRQGSNMYFNSTEHVEVFEHITKFVNIVALSVDRTIYGNGYRYSRDYNDFAIQEGSVNERLNNLIDKFMNYKLNLEIKTKISSSKFQKEVLKSILYNEDIDKIDLRILKDNSNFIEEKEGLYKAYNLLGVLDEDVSNKIDNHIKAIEDVYSKYKNGNLEINDIFPIALLSRTKHLVKLTIDIEKNKQEIYKPLKDFERVLNKFIKNKEFKFDSNKFIILKDRKPLNIYELSSGEKQIMILLIETLLQRGKPCIFIADEPELSLHIDWQEKILPTLRELNNKAQIIVATHSPEIAGGYPSKIRSMGEIING